MTKLTPFPSRQICGISFTRGEKLRFFSPKGFYSERDKASYEWLSGGLLIYGFNTPCNNMDASSLKVGGEFIGVINFRTTKNGNLPP